MRQQDQNSDSTESGTIDPLTDVPEENRLLQAKYKLTSLVYDFLDYPWERQYRRWRPTILSGVHGLTIEAGVGTGRNIEHYRPDVNLTGIDLSEGMLKHARRRARSAPCHVRLLHADASDLGAIPANMFDWYISTFMYCVMPDRLQPSAIREMARVLKPGGKFRLLEMVYSKDPTLRRRQERFAPFVERVYGARFDRRTLEYVKATPGLEVERIHFLKADVYLLIEGRKDLAK